MSNEMPTDPSPEPSPLKRALIALDQMQTKLDASEQAKHEPIAIVGMSCRFPGAPGLDAFWQLLTDGVDAISEVPADRWDIDRYFDPDPEAPGKMSTRFGGFIDDVDLFEPQFFGIAPREASSMDPQQRLLLEVSWEALEHAGIAPDRLFGSRTGVFIGITSTDYAKVQIDSSGLGGLDAYYASGIAHSIASGRLSYVLGLEGPSMAIDTACSSSLVAVHLAVQSLRGRECRVALAGGVNLILTPDNTITLSKFNMLAPDGRCKTFDAAADGFVRSEGCGMVVLKRLSDARADGDPIIAVIRGSAVNQDGRSSGLTAPNGPSQEAVLRDAISNGGVAAHEVGYVEAHGTGTSLGDPIEVQALAAVLGGGRADDDPLALGSVKTNIGHLEGAAGVAGLIKAALVVQRGRIPPHLHLVERNALIDWESMPIVLPTTPTEWNSDRPRIAGVSGFGFSGTNAHVVVEQPPALEEVEAAPRPVHVLPLSARTSTALRTVAGKYADAVAGPDAPSLGDVCLTAGHGRAGLAHRVAVVADSPEQMSERLRAFAAGEASVNGITHAEVTRTDPPKVAFLFTGQGSQYAGMARGLHQDEKVFREALDRVADVIDPLVGASLLEVIYGSDGTSGDGAVLARTGWTQPALFAVEWALAELWRSWGVVPQALIGHSVGELVAAVFAGVMSLEDGARLIVARGRLMQGLPEGGAMAAVFAPVAEVEAAVASATGVVSLAAVNGPAHVVVSGAAPAVASVRDEFAARGARVQDLVVSHAFHSPLMEPMLDEFAEVANDISYSPPTRRIVSNLTGAPIGREIASADHWVQHVMAPVQFARGVEALRALSVDAFVEIGPHPVLSGMVRECLPDDDVPCVPSLRRDRDDLTQMAAGAGALHAAGVDLDWSAIAGPSARRRAGLPTYPFERARHWVKRRARVLVDDDSGHPVLGRRLPSPLPTPLFQSELTVDSLSYLDDHRVFGCAIIPATALLEVATAATDALPGGPFEVADFLIHEGLFADEEAVTTVQTVVTPDDRGATVEVHSRRDGDAKWTLHASTRVLASERVPPDAIPMDEVRERCTVLTDADEHYELLAERGVVFGPSLRGVRQIWSLPGEALARIELPEGEVGALERYRVHPALLDAAVQPIASAASDQEDTYLPLSVDRFTVHRAATAESWSHVVIRDGAGSGAEVLTADVTLYDADGEPVAEIEGLRLKRADRAAFLRLAGTDELAEWMYEVDWRPADASDPAAGAGETAELPDGRRRWLVLADSAGAGETLAELLRASGCDVVVAPAHGSDHALDPASPDDFAALVDRCVEDGLDGVVHLWALDRVEGEHERALQGALHLTQALVRRGVAARLWLVTRGGQPAGGVAPDADQATLWGFGKAVALEHPELEPVCVDLDPSPFADVAGDLLGVLRDGGDEDQISVRGDDRLGARLVRSQRPGPVAPAELAFSERGTLDNLELHPLERRAPGRGEVEIRVHATALNFKDVLNVLGMYPGDPGGLGGECSGVVVAVGEGVDDLRVGDAVVALYQGSFRTHVTCATDLVVPKPPSVSFNDAAGMLIANVTSRFALFHVGHLQPGERVLVHAAAGGVGMAAVRAARRAGAEVYATAGSEQKRDYVRSLGVEHVYDSRTLDFADQIMADTGGEGIDVVLNSLAGDFIGRSLELLREGGRFLEMGKRDLLAAEQASRLGGSRGYHIIDWTETGTNDPQVIRSILLDCVADPESSLLPVRVFDFADASTAFRYMAQARHIGKVVVSQPNARLDVDRASDRPSIRPDATYLVTGGTRGVGLLTAAHLAERGARNLVLMGRRAPSDEAETAIEALRADGVHVRVVQGDVSQRSDVERALATEDSMPPVRGVFHAAGALDDGALSQQSWERFRNVLASKVDGTRHLDELTAQCELDHFVSYSSISSLLGSPGQTNYAAANAYLDAVAAGRAARGLPALTVGWGAWGEVGLAADRRVDERAHGLGIGVIEPAQGFEVLDRLMEGAPPYVAATPVDWPTLLRSLGDGRAPYLREVAGAAEHEDAAEAVRADVLRRLEEAPPHRRPGILLEFVRERAAHVLDLSPDEVGEHVPLSDLGIDSLMAVDLRNVLRSSLDMDRPIPSTLVFDFPTVAAITDFLAGETLDDEEVVADEGAEPAGSGAASDGASIDELFEDLESLSDEEIDRRLAERTGR